MTLVTYRNKLNTANFEGMGIVELRIFFAICSFLSDKNNNLITINQKELLPRITKGRVVQYAQFHRSIMNLNEQMKDFYVVNENGEKEKVFEVFFVDDTSHEITVQVKIEVSDLFPSDTTLDDIVAFHIEDFLMYRAFRTANLFRHFIEWKELGEVEYTLEELQDIIGVKKDNPSGKTTFYRTLHEAKEKFPNHLAEFKLTPIRKGRYVIGYRGTWNPSLTMDNETVAGEIFADFVSRPISIRFDDEELFE